MLCLCRLLLAAVAVSCTLSRIHANGPSTQRLDRIKDLMCVLLLSGMQKDDLDANVLNKLQRHNVNIHDLNNKELLRECTTYKYLNNENTTPYINTSVTKNSLNNFTTKIKDVNINLTNNTAKNDDNFNKREDRNKKNEDEIKYVDGQPELKSVLNFWKDIKIDNTSKTTESPLKINTVSDVVNINYRPEQKNKRNVPEASNSNESDAIQKLLVRILLKNQNKRKPAEKILDNGDDNNVYLFGTRNENKNTENNENYKTVGMAPAELAPLKVMAMPIKQYAMINSPSKDLINNLSKDDWQLKIPEGNSDRSKLIPIHTNKFNDILNAFESYYPIKSRDKSVENLNVNNKDIENIYFNKFSNREQSTTEKNPKITNQKISQNIIKEIANSVKELVLNDLRKEIFQTTASYTTTERPYNTRFITTGREIIAPAVKLENPRVEQTIINKFMDLFQEIKTLNHKTLIISSENKKANMFKEEAMPYNYPGVVPIPNNRMANSQSNYKTKQYIDSKTKKIYNFSQQVHKFRSNASATIIETPKKRVLPITFQTNNMEIPPIGIPVDIPENPINQNIIVTTMRPYRIAESGVDDDKIIHDSRNNYIPKKSEIRILKSQEPNIYDRNQQSDKRMPISNRERVSVHRYKEPLHRGNGVKVGTRPRFHERLERDRDYFDNTKHTEYASRVDCCDERYAYSKQMVDCCNRKIASRQQMSLNHMKKLPTYDDTHFNNFLKSQKKVTDMLERILASRSRVRSVETI